MSVGGPNPRYFKDGSGLKPNWLFALKWPRTYLWRKSPRWFKKARFRWRDRRHVPTTTPMLSPPAAVPPREGDGQ